MAFKVIKNALGKQALVPAGAVEAYKNLGWFVPKETKETKETQEPKQPSLSDDELFVIEVDKKPLQGWSNKEVREYARILKIDLSKAESAKEAKEIIKEYKANI